MRRRRIPTSIDQLTTLAEAAALRDQRRGNNDRLVALRDQLWAQEGPVCAAQLWQQMRGELERRRTAFAQQAAGLRRQRRAILDRLAREVRQAPPATDFAALFPATFEAAYMEAAGALLGTMHAAGGPSPLATEAQHEAFRLACMAAFNAGARCGLVGTEG